nr:transferase [uncultured Psychroserpens sp.]
MSKQKNNNLIHRGIRKRVKFFFTVNWYKTLYFNFKMLPFEQAKKLPFYFYGKVKFSSLRGSVKIEAPIKRAMVGFGQHYEMTSVSKGTSEVIINGKLIVRGYAQFGKDCFLMIGKHAILDLHNMVGMASGGKLICTNNITFKTYARVGSECQIIDTDFHQMIHSETGEKYEMTKPIVIGSHNYVGRWTSLMKGTITPDFCTIASNTLCNKSYLDMGNNILIGGIPAKLLKSNIKRDWEGERLSMEKNLIFQNRF